MRRVLLIVAVLVGGVWAGRLHAQTDAVCPPVATGAEAAGYYAGAGDAAFGRKDFSGAVFLYTCAIEQDASFAPVYVTRGFAYSELLDIERAQADFDEAVRLDETYLPAYINRGAFYTSLGNFGLAISDFTLVLALDPQNVIAYNNRAVVHAIERNYDLALADLEQAQTLDADYAPTYATLAAVYSALAAGAYQQFVDMADTPRLPAGTPSDVLMRLDDSLRTGDFAVWLALLVPVR